MASYFTIPIYYLPGRLVSRLVLSDVYFINKNVDHLLIVSAIVLWLAISLRAKLRFVVAIVYGGIYLAGVVTNIAILIEIAVVISIPLVVSLTAYDRLSKTKFLKGHLNLYLNYFSIIISIFGILSIIVSLAITPLSNPTRLAHVPDYAYSIFVVLGSTLSPVFMILIINAAPVKILAIECVKRISKIKRKVLAPLSISQEKTSRKNRIIYLSLIILLTILLVLVPHLPAFNKNNRLIGSDSANYAKWESSLVKSSSPQDFIRKAFVTLEGGDRPIALIFLFAVIKVMPVAPIYIIDIIPIILGPALVIAIYFFTRELTSNDTISLLASFLTAVSFHMLVGIYAGYYANWFALIIGYVAFVFLFRFLKTLKRANLVVYFFLITLVLLSHTYTWTILTIVTVAFLLVMLTLTNYSKRGIILLLVVIFSSVIVDIAKITFTKSAGGIEQDISVARRQEVGVGQLPVRWNNLLDTTEIYYAGAFSNFIILTLGLYWLFRSDIRDPANIFLVVFFAIGILPLFFGNWLVQSRVFYNIPFQIPAAIGLFYIKKEKGGVMLLISLCIYSIAMAIRTLSLLGAS
jgi:hypothetical protein